MNHQYSASSLPEQVVSTSCAPSVAIIYSLVSFKTGVMEDNHFLSFGPPAGVA
jgi:hypothetical protein